MKTESTHAVRAVLADGCKEMTEIEKQKRRRLSVSRRAELGRRAVAFESAQEYTVTAGKPCRPLGPAARREDISLSLSSPQEKTS